MAPQTITYTRVDSCPTRQAVLDAWKVLTAEQGTPPTAREIVEAIGGTVTVHTVYKHLYALARQGVIDRPKQQPGNHRRQRELAVEAVTHLRRPAVSVYLVSVAELARHLDIEAKAARKWLRRLAETGQLRSAEPIGKTRNWLVSFHDEEEEDV